MWLVYCSFVFRTRCKRRLGISAVTVIITITANILTTNSLSIPKTLPLIHHHCLTITADPLLFIKTATTSLPSSYPLPPHPAISHLSFSSAPSFPGFISLSLPLLPCRQLQNAVWCKFRLQYLIFVLYSANRRDCLSGHLAKCRHKLFIRHGPSWTRLRNNQITDAVALMGESGIALIP